MIRYENLSKVLDSDEFIRVETDCNRFWHTRAVTACGVALIAGTRAVLENALDAAKDEDFDVIQRTGYVAVQSTPLMSADNSLLGVLSTHYRQPRLPGINQFRVFDQFLKHTDGPIRQTSH